MAEEKLVIRNIGLILSGKLEQPVTDGDCIVSVGGRIAEVGFERDLDCGDADSVVDANGVALAPGLIDSHVHPVVGDYTPRSSSFTGSIRL